jgi:hypothetical protein
VGTRGCSGDHQAQRRVRDFAINRQILNLAKRAGLTAKDQLNFDPMGTLRLGISGTLLRGSLELDGVRIEFSAARPVLGFGEGCEIKVPRGNAFARRHVEFDQLDGVIRVTDLGSSQGIFINRVHKATRTPWPLRDGDKLHIGVQELLIRLE